MTGANLNASAGTTPTCGQRAVTPDSARPSGSGQIPKVVSEKPKPEPLTPGQSVLGTWCCSASWQCCQRLSQWSRDRSMGIARHVAWLPPRRRCSAPGCCRAGWGGSGRRWAGCRRACCRFVAGLDIGPADQAVLLLVAAWVAVLAYCLGWPLPSATGQLRPWTERPGWFGVAIGPADQCGVRSSARLRRCAVRGPPMTPTALSCHTTLSGDQGRLEIAAEGGTDRRSAKNAAAPMNQSREAHPLGAAAPLPLVGHNQRKWVVRPTRGYARNGVSLDVGPPCGGWHWPQGPYWPLSGPLRPKAGGCGWVDMPENG